LEQDEDFTLRAPRGGCPPTGDSRRWLEKQMDER